MNLKFSSFLRDNNYSHFELKAILFDMDGVLYDSMPAHERSWQQTADEFGLHAEPNEFYLHEGRTGDSTINLLFNRTYNRSATDQEIKRIYARKTELFSSMNDGKVMQGAIDLLTLAQQVGMKTILVTGSGQASLLERLDMNFPGVFTNQTMVTAADVQHGKPHPEPFLKGLRIAGDLQPYEALVVENAPLGTQAASKAGIFTVCVNTGPLNSQVLYDSGAQIVFDSVPDLCRNFNDLLKMADDALPF